MYDRRRRGVRELLRLERGPYGKQQKKRERHEPIMLAEADLRKPGGGCATRGNSPGTIRTIDKAPRPVYNHGNRSNTSSAVRRASKIGRSMQIIRRMASRVWLFPVLFTLGHAPALAR